MWVDIKNVVTEEHKFLICFLLIFMRQRHSRKTFEIATIFSLMGYAYRSKVFSGQEDKRNRTADERHLGVSNNVVLQLARVILRGRNHIVFFDNSCTSLLLEYIYRIVSELYNSKRNCREQEESNEDEVTYEKRISLHDGVDFLATVWKDIKAVPLLSTYIGLQCADNIHQYEMYEYYPLQNCNGQDHRVGIFLNCLHFRLIKLYALPLLLSNRKDTNFYTILVRIRDNAMKTLDFKLKLQKWVPNGFPNFPHLQDR
uniref:PiggyBac transposable element-derived protein domain-containing protein n=1 Tax=Glossina palpalis gambiensis TaxID=67801 RepID=A0A1B0BZ18_9MUSC